MIIAYLDPQGLIPVPVCSEILCPSTGSSLRRYEGPRYPRLEITHIIAAGLQLTAHTLVSRCTKIPSELLALPLITPIILPSNPPHKPL